MRELVGVVFALVAACGGGGMRTTQTGVPENSAPQDCGSTAAVITRVLAAENEAKNVEPVKVEVTKRCTEDAWTAQARTCLIAASTTQAITDCGYKNLTQEQQDKLDKATTQLTSMDVERAMQDMAKFRDQFCACKDAACAQQVSDELTKWSQELAKKEKNPPQLSEAQQKQAAEIGEQMGKCMQTAMTASLPPAAPLALPAVDPPNGDASGGTYVKITGTNFVNEGPRNAKVFFGSKQGTVIRFASDTELIVEAPGGKANETVDIKIVFDPGGEMTLPKAFTFGKPKKKKK